jgi:hypothetical protein
VSVISMLRIDARLTSSPMTLTTREASMSHRHTPFAARVAALKAPDESQPSLRKGHGQYKLTCCRNVRGSR